MAEDGDGVKTDHNNEPTAVPIDAAEPLSPPVAPDPQPAPDEA